MKRHILILVLLLGVSGGPLYAQGFGVVRFGVTEKVNRFGRDNLTVGALPPVAELSIRVTPNGDIRVNPAGDVRILASLSAPAPEDSSQRRLPNGDIRHTPGGDTRIIP